MLLILSPIVSSGGLIEVALTNLEIIAYYSDFAICSSSFALAAFTPASLSSRDSSKKLYIFNFFSRRSSRVILENLQNIVRIKTLQKYLDKKKDPEGSFVL